MYATLQTFAGHLYKTLGHVHVPEYMHVYAAPNYGSKKNNDSCALLLSKTTCMSIIHCRWHGLNLQRKLPGSLHLAFPNHLLMSLKLECHHDRRLLWPNLHMELSATLWLPHPRSYKLKNHLPNEKNSGRKGMYIHTLHICTCCHGQSVQLHPFDIHYRAFKDCSDESGRLTCNTEKDKGVRLHHRTAGNTTVSIFQITQ